jgi:putative addiction module antidote
MTIHEPKPETDAAQRGRVKVVQIGNSLGVVLSKELLARLNVSRGDHLHISEGPEGVVLSPYDPEVARQIESGRRFMKQYRDTFRALAK